MDLYMRDLYPNMGLHETSTTVQPDETDQHALVDDQKTAQEYNTKTANKKNIFLAIIGIVAVAFIMGVLKK